MGQLTRIHNGTRQIRFILEEVLAFAERQEEQASSQSNDFIIIGRVAPPAYPQSPSTVVNANGEFPSQGYSTPHKCQLIESSNSVGKRQKLGENVLLCAGEFAESKQRRS
jgi:hypothetical protein